MSGEWGTTPVAGGPTVAQCPECGSPYVTVEPAETGAQLRVECRECGEEGILDG